MDQLRGGAVQCHPSPPTSAVVTVAVVWTMSLRREVMSSRPVGLAVVSPGPLLLTAHCQYQQTLLLNDAGDKLLF